jgi:very-short-patch-repair endonuclease
MSVHPAEVRELAARQADVVAAWQLRRRGWSARRIDRWVVSNDWRVVHRGVYALTRAPLARRQLWFAATLTTPRSVLGQGSAGACIGFYSFAPGYETIVRPGTGPLVRHPGLLVRRSLLLAGEVTRWDGILVTTTERTMIDIAAGGLSERAIGRMFREALRLRRTTVRRVDAALDRHRRRRGTRVLRELAARYGEIPYERARSDAEARALEHLHDANAEAPRVNYRVAGEEADLVWLREKAIVEIDGPQFHRFPDEDARKQAKWEKAGFTVTRVPSSDVYARPHLLTEVATRHRRREQTVDHPQR